MREEILSRTRQRRVLRQDWVKQQLTNVGHTPQDAADLCEVGSRTWRDWVARGVFPASKQADIVYALFKKEGVADQEMLDCIREIEDHFEWS